MDDSPNHRLFLNAGAAFEAGLALLAFALGWMAGISPLEHLIWSWPALGWGLLATVPMIGLFVLGHAFPVGPLAGIRRFLVETLGPLLEPCRWYELLVLAMIVGLCEELLFRGVVQPWMEQWGPAFGLVGSNVIFGLAHFITPLYALLTGAAGLYLGYLFDATGQRNLLVPIVTHAVYDFAGFLIVARAYRREHGSDAVDF